ncbi:MAG: hypothetical protein HZA50_18185 [Planctomycetes bacterium]|nr:hypothetical protein [Planctomycetota bacterium]
MRCLTEILLFLVIAAAAALVGAGVIWLLGQPFHLEFGRSLWFSIAGLVFVLPATANIWIMFRGSDGEETGERALAGLRGFCLLLAGVFIAVPSIFFGAGWKVFLLCMGLCLVIAVATIPLAMWLSCRRRQRQSNQKTSGIDGK